MPFAAFLDGNRVISTLMSDEDWERARQVGKQEEDRLLIGATRLPGFARLSAAGLRHFAHRPGYAPEGSWAETQEHLALKAALVRLIDAAGWLVDTEVPSGPEREWIADVLAEKDGRRIAFEVQWSPQTADAYIDRTNRYHAAGIDCVWLARKEPETNARGLHEHTWAELEGVPVFLLADPTAVTTALAVNPTGIDAAAQVQISTMHGYVSQGLIAYDLPVFVEGVLMNRIKVQSYFELDVYESRCGNCKRRIIQWDLGSPLAGSAQRPEENKSIIHYVHQQQAAFAEGIPLAEIILRRSGVMPDGYKSFVCPYCSAVQPAAFEYENKQHAISRGAFVLVRVPVTAQSGWFAKRWDLPVYGEAVYISASESS